MFGTYKLIYEPGSDSPNESTVSMSFSGEATLSQMLTHYENFLIATGYQIDIDKTLEFVSNSPEDKSAPFEINADQIFNSLFDSTVLEQSIESLLRNIKEMNGKP
jgi:hypothetical protein